MTKSEILAIVMRSASQVSPLCAELMAAKLDLNNDICLVDLGVNSIDYAEIALDIMAELDIDVPLRTLANKNKISEVVDLIFAYKCREEEKV